MVTYYLLCSVIFKVYDTDGNGRIAFNEVMDVLRDSTGEFWVEDELGICLVSFMFCVVL